MSTTRRGVTHSRWWLPAFSLVLGAVMFAAFAIGGDTTGGLQSFGVMAAVAALFAFGASRSETLGGLGGPGRDERWAMIDLRATAFAGVAVIVAVIAGFLIEIARGHDGSPYALIGAIGGVTYVLAVIVLRSRA